MIALDEIARLIAAAAAARDNAYAPYSNFRVGAALLTDTGVVVTGCNIENVSYGATLCAERTAVAKAVSEGHRCFRAIAVVYDAVALARPCGLCRQVLMEFAPDADVIMANTAGAYECESVRALLPAAFSPNSIG
jgi:cytidine deaminase